MEPLENYKTEIRVYNVWVKKMKETYGDLGFMSWDEQDYQEALQKNHAFKMVDRVLGLTEDEVNKIWEEINNEKI